jgi:hypothetical protein
LTLNATISARTPSTATYAPNNMTSSHGVSPGQTSTTVPKIAAMDARSTRNVQLTASAASIGKLLL